MQDNHNLKEVIVCKSKKRCFHHLLLCQKFRHLLLCQKFRILILQQNIENLIIISIFRNHKILQKILRVNIYQVLKLANRNRIVNKFNQVKEVFLVLLKERQYIHR